MSSENEEKPRKKQKTDSLEVGRLLGIIARVDPELYEAISRLAEETNDTPTNIVIRSLKNYFLIQKVEATNMNVSQLLLAFDVFTRIAETITKIYTSLGALFFSEMTSSIGDIIEKRVKERLEALSASTAQAEKKPSDIELRLKSKLADVFEGVVEELLRMAFKMSGLKVPEALKVKIPVNIEFIEEKKEDKGIEVKVI